MSAEITTNPNSGIGADLNTHVPGLPNAQGDNEPNPQAAEGTLALDETLALGGTLAQKARLPLVFFGLLALQTLTTFFSESKFVPGIANNIGAFEFSFVLLLGCAFVYFLVHQELTFRFHPLMIIFGVLFLFALISLYHYLSPHFDYGFIQVLILGFLLLFLFTLFNLLTLDEKYLIFVLRCLVVSTFIVGVWVLSDQVSSGGDYTAAGPFRNRTHSGIYMSGAFWIVLLYSFWPGLKRWERWLTYPTLGVALYCVSTSLRQSVYVAVLVGLLGLSIGMLIASGTNRLRVAIPVVTVWVVGFLVFINAQQSGFVPLMLFYREFSGIEKRLGEFSGTREVAEGSRDFDDLQRQGGLVAFETSPLIGIGWGGFGGSTFSPTGHEMHSTPWRFLAELGVVGAILYVSLMSLLILRAIRLLIRARNTPYQLSALVLVVALVSCGVSHYYNRMFTDRPYWWMLVIYMTFEYYLAQQLSEAKPVPAPQPVLQLETGTIASAQHG